MSTKLILCINKNNNINKYELLEQEKKETLVDKNYNIPQIRQNYQSNYYKWYDKNKNSLDYIVDYSNSFVQKYDMENYKFTIRNSENFKQQLLSMIYHLKTRRL